jgi:DNA (cytosine-5)-methyltransferase 1
VTAYYNEVDPFNAGWLRNLVAAGLIPAGDVDDRSICDVQPDDLRGYVQCHFFAGLGGWGDAARLAGWPDDRAIWTGSPPCQPWSIAGPRGGAADERHLWPELFRLASAARPAVLMGEQVADAAGQGWLDDVARDMEGVGYAFRACVLPACSVGAFHRRDRIYFVADASGEGLPGAKCSGRGEPREAPAEVGAATAERDRGAPWRDHRQSRGADGLTRMVKPGARLMAHGIPARMGVLGALGNAIVPQLAAEVMAAFMECHP